jgi:hypothetical protein
VAALYRKGSALLSLPASLAAAVGSGVGQSSDDTDDVIGFESMLKQNR